jgi:amino acid transporter
VKQLFATKSLEQLQKEAASATESGQADAHGHTGLRRVLGPVGLTSIGVGAIIGAGIFVMTGRAAAQYAGPGIMLSYVIAGLACVFAAMCYAEFAAMAPAAGSAYTYSYATLGELLAWLMGWDLILEYAMACSTVAVAWSEYFNELLYVTLGVRIPPEYCNDPFSMRGAYFNAPAVLITVLLTVLLVRGIKESTTANTALVLIKVSVVLLVIAVGATYVNPANWTNVPVNERILPESLLIDDVALAYAEKKEALHEEAAKERAAKLSLYARTTYSLERLKIVNDEQVKESIITPEQANARTEQLRSRLRQELLAEGIDELEVEQFLANKVWPNPADRNAVEIILTDIRKEAVARSADKWGLLGLIGVDQALVSVDDQFRSNFFPYGLSGLIFGASIVFFAYIGFDSVATHAEEAINPQVSVPIGILASLLICTVLYILVSAVITGMQPYPTINPKAAVAAAFTEKGLRIVPALIAIGGLAGMTSVLLISFQAQTRIFLAMARDGLLPKTVFATIHPRFRTPHISTIVVGVGITIVAAFTPIERLEKMVNIGTLLAFTTVCAAVLLLRIRRPDFHRPFRTPAVYIVAVLGILANAMLMLFLDPTTWLAFTIWISLGLVVYFGFGYWNSSLRQQLRETKAA